MVPATWPGHCARRRRRSHGTRFHVRAGLHPGPRNATATPARPASPPTIRACNTASTRRQVGAGRQLPPQPHPRDRPAHSCGVRSPRASPSPCPRDAGHPPLRCYWTNSSRRHRCASPRHRRHGAAVTQPRRAARRERDSGRTNTPARLRRMPGFPQSESPARGVGGNAERRETPSGRSIRPVSASSCHVRYSLPRPFASSPW